MRFSIALAAPAALLLTGASSWAAISATADITTSQTSAPFTYTINLHNTGDTNIGAFWFAWTDHPRDYDFLPTSPTNIVMPSGWVAPVTHSLVPGDGYGIEFYSIGGNLIGPGQSSSAFQFTSKDSPSTLAGDAFFPPFKVTNSFVYIGFPQGDPGFEFVATVPEPVSAGAVAVFGCIALASRRKRA
jgi:hypothetical protein